MRVIRRRNALITFVLLLLPSFGCQQSNQADQSGSKNGPDATFENQESDVTADLVAAEQAQKQGNYEVSTSIYRRLLKDHPQHPDAARWALFLGESYRGSGQITKAVEAYRHSISFDGSDPAVHSRLAFLLSATGQNRLAQPHYEVLVRNGTALPEELALFGDVGRPVDQRDFLESCEEKAPGDPLVELGLAVHDFWDERFEASRQRLRVLLAESPELVAGQAIEGRARLDGADQDFIVWHDQLPDSADDWPSIWVLRGLFAKKKQNSHVAASCFLEALQRNSEDREATYQLGQALSVLGDPESKSVLDRADQLIEYSNSLDPVVAARRPSEAHVLELVDSLERMGRYWEACSWALAFGRLAGRRPWMDPLIAKYEPSLLPGEPIRLASTDASTVIELGEHSSFEAFVDHVRTSINKKALDGREGTVPSIKFERSDVSIEFVYNNGADSATAGSRMFEQNGGGVGVTDFDRDHRPDLFFAQGQPWISGESEPVGDPSIHDVLYRNRGGRFEEVTGQSKMPPEAGYGQGVAVGDYNADGFDDLYIGNVGQNQLLINQGDGTFRGEAIESDDAWTASVVMVDFDGDSWPDLFDVNYLEGEGIYTAVCDARACSPTIFSGARNCLLLNSGSGQQRVAETLEQPGDSKSLGAVVLPLGNPQTPAVFITNDQTPNFLMRPGNHDGGSFTLADDALFSGVAYNEIGRTDACMGIAADDVDGNGLVDLFVTNFSSEVNTLFLQQSRPSSSSKAETERYFVDATRRASFGSASLDMVGWGAQFLDADLDGDPDLVLVNGNVDDEPEGGSPYAMRPQFFRHEGDVRFQELMAESVGDYFGGQYAGRGLAKLDWNCDGHVDFLACHIGSPSALVTNVTETEHGYFHVKLHATSSARDAIGTVVTVSTDAGATTRTLLAGDGYLCSNERAVSFGLPYAKSVVEVSINWPSGTVQMFRNLPLNSQLEVVENGSSATLWNRLTPRAVKAGR